MTASPGTATAAGDRERYPVRVDAVLQSRLSRGLWLVKWLLLIPHFVVLGFLWLAFLVVSVVAFFSILLTARYPRALFEFNLGVLRWSWRVFYYGYGALGTDRYPPFTLAEAPDYPAHLDVPYPERLSRGLVLVKWWLLAIPHYLVLAVFIGGGLWLSTRTQTAGWNSNWASGGLVGLLVLIAGVVLLFTGRYPVPLYDFVLGMDRWALRVAAYVGLMTDRYPPFRLDTGGTDPGSVPAGPPPIVAPSPPGAAPGGRGGWTAGRVASLVIGAVLLFTSTGLLAGGGWLLWADRTQREGGFLWTPTATVSTSGYALTAEGLQLEGSAANPVINQVVGTVRIRATATDTATALFVGVTTTADAQNYLSGVPHTRFDAVGTGVTGTLVNRGGAAPATPPGETNIWQASAAGTGTQSLQWHPGRGNWTVVVMRADGAAGVSARLRAAATVPAAPWLAAGLLGVGALFLAGGAVLIGLAAHGAGAAPRAPAGPPTGLPTPRTPSEPAPERPVGTTSGPPWPPAG